MRATVTFTVFTLFISLALSASPLLRQGLIVPGKSVGQMSLGPNGYATLRQFGKPLTSDAGMSQTRQIWVGSGDDHPTLYIHTVANGAIDAKPARGITIDEIRTSSPRFRTASGFGVGSTLVRVEKGFPGARFLARKAGPLLLVDRRQGIGFEFPHEGAGARCVGVTVWVPGRAGIVTSEEVSRLLRQHRQDVRRPKSGE